MFKLFTSLGAINAAVAVILGAFGAHTLEGRLSSEMLSVFQTGVQYHFYHTLGLLAVGILAYHLPESFWLKWSGWLMVVGIVLFSGSLYVLSLTGIHWLGAITPLGGIVFIISWLLLAVAVIKF